MARLILHIGTHKTGTTWVQDCLAASRARLAEAQIIYPDLSPHSGHHGYLTDWIKLPAAYVTPDGGCAGLVQLAHHWRESGATLLLSSEELSRAGGPGGHPDFKALRDIFAGYEILVLCLLRDQVSFLQSVYAEIARARLPPRPPELVEMAMKTGIVDGVLCDYGQLYTRLRQSFAADEIRLLDYHAARKSPGGVLASLMRYIAPGLPLETVTPRTTIAEANVSPRALTLWAALAVAGEGLADARLCTAADTAFDLEFGQARQSSLFTRAEYRQLAAHFTPLNAALSAQICRLQPGFSLTPFAPAPDLLWREDLGPGYWARLARRLWLAPDPPAAATLRAAQG
ncbi:hypothetical protein ACM25N_12735 [Roseovarius sp. C7]|uniref:hypothetical protein n=1 Tax=Roseovarius sp. C7 TaxID=3398643 RepID=UPI0039F6D6FA